MTEQSNETAKVEQAYVVQARLTLPDAGTGRERWEDIATVMVPTRTHRKTVIEKALQEAGMMPSEPGDALDAVVRVLDAESAREVQVGSVQPPAQLVIGDA